MENLFRVFQKQKRKKKIDWILQLDSRLSFYYCLPVRLYIYIYIYIYTHIYQLVICHSQLQISGMFAIIRWIKN